MDNLEIKGKETQVLGHKYCRTAKVGEKKLPSCHTYTHVGGPHKRSTVFGDGALAIIPHSTVAIHYMHYVAPAFTEIYLTLLVGLLPIYLYGGKI